jgi:hypothetical protein
MLPEEGMESRLANPAARRASSAGPAASLSPPDADGQKFRQPRFELERRAHQGFGAIAQLVHRGPGFGRSALGYPQLYPDGQVTRGSKERKSQYGDKKQARQA